ncbi:dynein regulatory complex protein 9 isoform X2 [Lepeophtheirus salmonis]|uniref:dynein regulatory complex protein 9 isoform X2 n=1 Tax=Lepeophtheirus salmonis TaxID=72036 RepID=UPI001AEA8EB4|nr:dynein regulatory complex protein 9-like [Lepeophtheirus salmonis]
MITIHKYVMESKSKLKTLECILMQSILENVVDQLAVVGGTMIHPSELDEDWASIPHPNATQEDLGSLLRKENELFQKKLRSAQLDPSLTDDAPAIKAYSIQKVYREVRNVQMMLEKTIQELKTRGTSTTLKRAVHQYKERMKEKRMIGYKAKSIGNEITNLRYKIVEAIKTTDNLLLSESTKIAQLKDHLLDVRKVCKIEQDFMSQYFFQHESQYIRNLKTTEKELLNEKSKVKEEIEYEKKVTAEIEECLRGKLNTLTKLHKTWCLRLQVDVKVKDEELQKLKKARIQDQSTYKLALIRLKEITEFVENDKKNLERSRLEKEQYNMEIRAIIRIQSWWRMSMVRKGLGPYKKRKKRVQDHSVSLKKGK